MASPHLFVNLPVPSTFPYFIVMQSLHHHHHTLYRFRRRFALSATASFQFPSHKSRVQERWSQSLALPPRARVKAFDDGDSFGSSDWGNDDGGYVSFASSSDEGESDGEYVLNPVADIDLPAASVTGSNDAVNLTAHRLGMIGRGGKRRRIRYGNFVNFGLVAFLSTLLVFVDWWAWKIVRLPLAPFYLACPFFISAALVSFVGYLSVPLLNDLRVHQVMKKELPINHSKKRATPTMGGLFVIPIGVGVAQFFARSSVEVFGAVVATLAFSAIGLLDDILTLIKKNGSGLSAWIKLSLQVSVGIIFFVWLQTASISSPYSMYTLLKMLIPLPASLGLVYLGKSYILLTSVCFASMGSGVNLTDGLDGLAGGTAALAFIGMSIAVLPICSELGIFGSSMAGACVGFLLHNRHKASIFMGDTGSLALGGALAAMAACTGMFFPLFISSGIFVLEASSVIMQVLYFKTTKRWSGTGHRLLRMAPLHHHLELCGFKEPVIVASAYVISGLLALFAGYVGLISA